MPRPYPEALPGARGDGWKVQPLPHGGRTDLVRRLMFADCSASDVGLMTRIHEQLHAALTPVKGADDLVAEYGVHPFALQAAEDCRLNHAVQIMRSRGTLAGPLADVYLGETMSEATLSAWRDQWIRARDTGGAVAVDGAASAVCLAVACYPGEDWARIERLAGEVWGGAVQSKIDQVLTWVDDQALFSPRGAREVVKPFPQSTVPLARLLSLLFSSAVEPGEPGGGGDPDQEGQAGADGVPPWGPLTIHEPVLEVDHELRRLLRRRRPSDVGVVIGSVDRLLTDGQCFLVDVMRPGGGTVLIDASGSMRLSADQVREIVTAVPAATVATYGASERRGDLYVVASRGRMAGPTSAGWRPGGCNVVDGPALAWLAQQPEPRVWVSDGVVTGLGDDACLACDLDRDRIVREGRIRRVGDVTGAVDALKGGR